MTEVITREVPNIVVYVLSEVQRIKQIHAFSLGYFKRSSSAKGTKWSQKQRKSRKSIREKDIQTRQDRSSNKSKIMFNIDTTNLDTLDQAKSAV